LVPFDNEWEGGRVFFSEEKKQKTFIFWPWPGGREAMAGE
jgi:hypothetical protein